MIKRVMILGLLCLLCVLVSCKSAEVQKPEPIDLHPSMEILFDSRPDNSRLEIITDIQTIDDILLNSAAYMKAWELWETYSESLETYIRNIGEAVSRAD